MTLTRFLGDYIYLPLSMILARYAVRHRVGKWPMFLLAVIVPVNVTFLVSGIWHGAGWNFIAFGVFTGIAMTVANSSRRAAMPELPRAAAWLLTMLAFLIGLCFFRARSPEKAIDMMVASVAGSWSAVGPFSRRPVSNFSDRHIRSVAPLRRPSSGQVRSPPGAARVDLGSNLLLLDRRHCRQPGQLRAFVYFDF